MFDLAKTRQKNGTALQNKISSLSGSWRSGKFMPLTSRPFSANCYALSKVWYRCHCVNLRESDISGINSSVKKWPYADMFLKPEESVLFRPCLYGGLGLISVRHKAKACQIRTFLEMSVNHNYVPSLFLVSLFKVFVLDDDTIQMKRHPYLMSPK